MSGGADKGRRMYVVYLAFGMVSHLTHVLTLERYGLGWTITLKRSLWSVTQTDGRSLAVSPRARY